MCIFKQKTDVLVKYKVLATIPPAPMLALKSLVKESEVAKTSLSLCRTQLMKSWPEGLKRKRLLSTRVALIAL